jgi:hypothetical protein
MTLADARPALAALGDRVPAGLRDLAGADGERRWSSWLRQRDGEIRRRLATGDEDSVVNLMLYGTRFTRWPRATPQAIAGSTSHHARIAEVMDGRVADLAAAIESPGDDERLRFVREVVERHGLTVSASGREATRQYLVELRSRVLSENDRYRRRLAAVSADAEEQRAAGATLYRDRGLSPDTSLRVDFALEQTLAALRDRGEFAGRPAGRLAVVGPGLDLVNKAQGYDFFPVQTIQPFALADSLRRLGLAERVSIAALDVSPRVIAHLRDARRRAAEREPYRVNVLLERDTAGSRLDPALVEYWRRFGDRVGSPAEIETPAAYASQVRARGVNVRPEMVLDVRELELNVVFERLADTDPSKEFDLVVATNVLVYYDSFEQALAAANMASMLREGGLLLTNGPVPVPAVSGLSPVLIMSVVFERLEPGAGSRERGDSILVYRKQ